MKIMINTSRIKKVGLSAKLGQTWRTIKRYKVLYLFLLPAVVWFFVFCYIPMGGLIMVAKDYSFVKGILASPWEEPWYKNFQLFFNMPELKNMVKNTVVIALLRLALFPAPIILAIMLNEVRNPVFKKIVQTISYFPFFISWVIVTSMLEQLLTPYGSGGPLYHMMQLLSGSDQVRYYMIDKPYFYPLAVITYLWKTIGWNSIVYLAAISNIDPSLFEAAEIDGCSRMRVIRKVILPHLKTPITLLFVMALGSIMSAGFEQIYFLQSPANYDYSNVLDVLVVKYGIEQGKYAIAAVAGLFQGVIGLIFIVIGNTVTKKTGGASLW